MTHSKIIFKQIKYQIPSFYQTALFDHIRWQLNERCEQAKKYVTRPFSQLPEHLKLAKLEGLFSLNIVKLRAKGITGAGIKSLEFLLKHLLPKKTEGQWKFSALKNAGKLTYHFLKQKLFCRPQEFYYRYIPQLEKIKLVTVKRDRIRGNTYMLNTKEIMKYLPEKEVVVCTGKNRKGKIMTLVEKIKTKTGKEHTRRELTKRVKESSRRKKNGEPLKLTKPVKEMIDYWNNQSVLCNYSLDKTALLHPTKKLKMAIEALQGFRGGTFFRDNNIYIPEEFADSFDCTAKRTVHDFISAVDRLVALATSPNSPIAHAKFIKNLTIFDFLHGIAYPKRLPPLYITHCQNDAQKTANTFSEQETKDGLRVLQSVNSVFPDYFDPNNAEDLNICIVCGKNLNGFFNETTMQVLDALYANQFDFIVRRGLPKYLSTWQADKMEKFLFKGKRFPLYMHTLLDKEVRKGFCQGQIYIKGI